MKKIEEKRFRKWRPKPVRNQVLLPLLLIIAIIVIMFMFRDFTLEDRAIEIPHEGLLEVIVGYAILLAEIAAMLVVAVSVIETIYNFIRGLLDRKRPRIRSSETLRLRLGHRLSLALEFALASDILRVAISPTLSDLMFLFVIILLRELINHFLEEEFAAIKSSARYPDLQPCDTDEEA
ncbi:MAG: DUF1622 domain-containing protein [Chloroflexi bacterium]|jgi:uncharacterized membrane protein|nr:DUF1622 domain-containing protein [Chloroflexota bacterium]